MKEKAKGLIFGILIGANGAFLIESTIPNGHFNFTALFAFNILALLVLWLLSSGRHGDSEG